MKKLSLLLLITFSHIASAQGVCNACYQRKAALTMECARDQAKFSLFPVYCVNTSIQSRLLKRYKDKVDPLFKKYPDASYGYLGKRKLQNPCDACFNNILVLRLNHCLSGFKVPECPAIRVNEVLIFQTFRNYPYVMVL